LDPLTFVELMKGIVTGNVDGMSNGAKKFGLAVTVGFFGKLAVKCQVFNISCQS
jgi:hypothetical protein